MKVPKSYQQLLIAGISSIPLTMMLLGTSQQPANAQFAGGCINTSPQDGYGFGDWYNTSEDVSIDRQIYTTVARMRSPSSKYPASMTCPLRPEPGELRYGVGFREGLSSSPVVLRIYLDGNEVSNQTIYPGQLFTNLLDISNARNLSVESTCTSADYDNCREIIFTQFEIKRFNSPGAR